MSSPARVNVLGVGVSAVNLKEAVELLEQWIAAGDRRYVCVCNVHSVMACRRSEELRDIFNQASLVTPDGMPLVWLGRSRHANVTRVYGPDLMLALLEAGIASGRRHFFYGGHEGVTDRLAKSLKERFPGLLVAGALEPPVASVDELCTPEAASLINAAGADVVWVGVGSPKQERWMARMRPRLEAPVLIGVGAAFDFHAGTVRQAPPWMRRSGLEWLFRLALEPRRLWRRYLVDNPWFVWEVLLQRLGLRHYEI